MDKYFPAKGDVIFQFHQGLSMNYGIMKLRQSEAFNSIKDYLYAGVERNNEEEVRLSIPSRIIDKLNEFEPHRRFELSIPSRIIQLLVGRGMGRKLL